MTGAQVLRDCNGRIGYHKRHRASARSDGHGDQDKPDFGQTQRKETSPEDGIAQAGSEEDGEEVRSEKAGGQEDRREKACREEAHRKKGSAEKDRLPETGPHKERRSR